MIQSALDFSLPQNPSELLRKILRPEGAYCREPNKTLFEAFLSLLKSIQLNDNRMDAAAIVYHIIFGKVPSLESIKVRYRI